MTFNKWWFLIYAFIFLFQYFLFLAESWILYWPYFSPFLQSFLAGFLQSDQKGRKTEEQPFLYSLGKQQVQPPAWFQGPRGAPAASQHQQWPPWQQDARRIDLLSVPLPSLTSQSIQWCCNAHLFSVTPLVITDNPRACVIWLKLSPCDPSLRTKSGFGPVVCTSLGLWDCDTVWAAISSLPQAYWWFSVFQILSNNASMFQELGQAVSHPTLLGNSHQVWWRPGEREWM